MDAIIKRRSIRAYKNQKIEDEMIIDLIKMGMQAPSAHNQRPWQFVAITDREKLDHIAEIHPYAKMLKSAPLCIMVCGDLNVVRHGSDFWQQDCSAVVENILIAATERGLGSLWIGLHPKVDLISDAIETFNLPEGILPFAYIALGYADEEKEPRNYFDESRIHYNQW